MRLGRGFGQGLLAGTQAVGKMYALYDGIQQAEAVKDLRNQYAEIGAAQPTQTAAFSPEDMQRVQQAQDSGMTVTPGVGMYSISSPDNPDVAQEIRAKTGYSFLGKTQDTPFTPDQIKQGRYDKYAELMASSGDPAKGLQLQSALLKNTADTEAYDRDKLRLTNLDKSQSEMRDVLNTGDVTKIAGYFNKALGGTLFNTDPNVQGYASMDNKGNLIVASQDPNLPPTVMPLMQVVSAAQTAMQQSPDGTLTGGLNHMFKQLGEGTDKRAALALKVGDQSLKRDALQLAQDDRAMGRAIQVAGLGVRQQQVDQQGMGLGRGRGRGGDGGDGGGFTPFEKTPDGKARWLWAQEAIRNGTPVPEAMADYHAADNQYKAQQNLQRVMPQITKTVSAAYEGGQSPNEIAGALAQQGYEDEYIKQILGKANVPVGGLSYRDNAGPPAGTTPAGTTPATGKGLPQANIAASKDAPAPNIEGLTKRFNTLNRQLAALEKQRWSPERGELLRKLRSERDFTAQQFREAKAAQEKAKAKAKADAASSQTRKQLQAVVDAAGAES